MTNLTQMETEVLKAIAFHEMNTSNGAYPGPNDVYTYAWTDDFARDAGITIPQCKGVLSSLVQKGLIIADGKGRDATVSFTAGGYAAFVSVCPNDE